jgi:hypothetical protein
VSGFLKHSKNCGSHYQPLNHFRQGKNWAALKKSADLASSLFSLFAIIATVFYLNRCLRHCPIVSSLQPGAADASDFAAFFLVFCFLFLEATFPCVVSPLFCAL